MKYEQVNIIYDTHLLLLNITPRNVSKVVGYIKIQKSQSIRYNLIMVIDIMVTLRIRVGMVVVQYPESDMDTISRFKKGYLQ